MIVSMKLQGILPGGMERNALVPQKYMPLAPFHTTDKWFCLFLKSYPEFSFRVRKDLNFLRRNVESSCDSTRAPRKWLIIAVVVLDFIQLHCRGFNARTLSPLCLLCCPVFTDFLCVNNLKLSQFQLSFTKLASITVLSPSAIQFGVWSCEW